MVQGITFAIRFLVLSMGMYVLHYSYMCCFNISVRSAFPMMELIAELSIVLLGGTWFQLHSLIYWMMVSCSYESLCFSDDSNKRRPQRIKDFKDIEKFLHVPVQDRTLNCKPTLKLVLAVILLGTFLTLIFTPGVYHSDDKSRSVSQYISISSSPCFYLLFYSHFLASIYTSSLRWGSREIFPHLEKYSQCTLLCKENGIWFFCFLLALLSLPWKYFVTKVHCLQPNFWRQVDKKECCSRFTLHIICRN